jgi:hypothetical protein
MDQSNPYVTVGSPNYAAPLVNFGQFGQAYQNAQKQQQKPQNQQQPTLPNSSGGKTGPTQSTFAQTLQSFFGPPQGAQASAMTQPAAGSIGGANNLLAGLY